MKVKASSNFWCVPSQMYLQARTSMSGLNTSACAARTRELTPSARDDEVVIRDRLSTGPASVSNSIFTPRARGTILQDIEQPLAADAAEAVAAGAHHRAAIMNGDVVPIDERVADRLGAFGIVCVQIAERLVGQHHAPAKCVVRPVALDDDDFVRGIAQLQRNREIKAAWPASETRHAHDDHSVPAKS